MGLEDLDIAHLEMGRLEPGKVAKQDMEEGQEMLFKGGLTGHVTNLCMGKRGALFPLGS
jgi:hypothetical protein